MLGLVSNPVNMTRYEDLLKTKAFITYSSSEALEHLN